MLMKTAAAREIIHSLIAKFPNKFDVVHLINNTVCEDEIAASAVNTAMNIYTILGSRIKVGTGSSHVPKLSSELAEVRLY